MGGTLARKLGRVGHPIYLGVRDPKSEEAAKLVSAIGGGALAMRVEEAAAAAELALLCTPWPAAEEVTRAVAAACAGKPLVDCTNPLKKDLSALEVGFDTSGCELVQSWAPKAHVIKCFNTTGFNIMEDPVLEGRKTVMFYCGDDTASRKTVGALVGQLGFEPLDVGALSSARLLEPFALLWIQSAYKHGVGRDFSFGLLRRKNG